MLRILDGRKILRSTPVQIERKTIEVESYLTADDLGRAASLGAPGDEADAMGTSNANRDTWRAKAAISAVSALET
jgi:hypothetical protein